MFPEGKIVLILVCCKEVKETWARLDNLKSLRSKEMNVVCCLVMALFILGLCYPPSVLNVCPGCWRTRWETEKIYSQMMWILVTNLKWVIVPWDSSGQGRKGKLLTLMKKDICQTKTTETTSYYSAVMPEGRFACHMSCSGSCKANAIRKHRIACIARQIYLCKWHTEKLVLHRHTLSLQLCQQVHIYLVVIQYLTSRW